MDINLPDKLYYSIGEVATAFWRKLFAYTLLGKRI